MGGTECFCCQTLCITDYRDWMAEIVEHLHRIYIDIKTRSPEELSQLRIAAATFVPRHIERNEASPLHPHKRLLNGRIRLGEIGHYFSSDRRRETRSS